MSERLKPAIFFDRDNTLIICNDYLGDASQVKLAAGASESVARARMLGFAVVIVSNQSGVARGMFDEDAVRKVNDRLAAMLLEGDASASVDAHEFCPYHPDAPIEAYRQDSELRKPQPGMLLKAAREKHLHLAKSWCVGDAPRDIEAGKRAGCRTVLVRDTTLTASPAAMESLSIEPDYIASSLTDALDFIEMHTEAPAEPTAKFVNSAVAMQSESVTATHAASVVEAPIAETSDAVAIDPTPETASELAGVSSQTRDVASEEAIAVTSDSDEAALDAIPLNVEPVEVVQEPTMTQSASDLESSKSRGTLPSSMATLSGTLAQQMRAPAPTTRAKPETEDAPATDNKQSRLLLSQILDELRHKRESPQDFSIAKMLGGLTMGLALATLFGAYLSRDKPGTHESLMMLAIFLQVLSASLYLMGK